MPTPSHVDVAEAPVLLYQATGADPETVMLDNHGTGDVTLGDANVVAGQGPLLKANEPPQTLTLYEDSIYGRCAAGTSRVEVLAWISASR